MRTLTGEVSQAAHAAAVGEAISGGRAVLIPGTLAVSADGVAIAINGEATITQGLDMMQEDLVGISRVRRKGKMVRIVQKH